MLFHLWDVHEGLALFEKLHSSRQSFYRIVFPFWEKHLLQSALVKTELSFVQIRAIDGARFAFRCLCVPLVAGTQAWKKKAGERQFFL